MPVLRELLVEEMQDLLHSEGLLEEAASASKGDD